MAMARRSVIRRAWDYIAPRVRDRLRSEYARKLHYERTNFQDCETVHELPAIFHYWSNKHLRPKHERLGISDPEQFFFKYALRQCERNPGNRTRIGSLGAGNCDTEARLASRLLEAGRCDFVVECVDINDDMLQRGRQHAKTLGVDAYLTHEKGNFNRWRPKGQYDVVIANQALHHVVKLEDLFAQIRKRMAPNGVFLTSDMIGRNGHVRWPEARKALQPFWDELPEAYRFNHVMNRDEPQLIDEDTSRHSFEGVRSQDILPLLVANFPFELFIPFGNIILVFVDRTFGPNFDAEAEWDRDFVDRVHARDEAGIMSGELKPTQMLAVLRNEPVETQLVHPKLTPEFCIRRPDRAPT